MNSKTCQNCNNLFYKYIIRCASCYELNNWEPKVEKENNNAETIHSE